ncbi:MAG: BrnA antitoxin family protein [Burkholderiales bacterium]
MSHENRIRSIKNEIPQKSLCSQAKKSVTMRLSEDVIGYFKQMAEEKGIPYQSLINLYLRDCVSSHRKIDISWQK